MKKNVITLAITCVCAISALFFQSCAREVDVEDYDQAIIGDWELTRVTESGKVYQGWGTAVFLGNCDVELSEFEEPCRISFKNDGTFITMYMGQIHADTYIKYTIIGEDISMKDAQFTFYCRYERTGLQDTIIPVTPYSIKIKLERVWKIDRMTQNELILKCSGGESLLTRYSRMVDIREVSDTLSLEFKRI